MVQGCLARMLGPSVPQSGIMDGSTRRAIRAFQSQSQLPATGLLDDSTMRALREGCMGPSGPPAGGPPPPPEDAGAAEPPPSGEPEPAAAAEPGGEPGGAAEPGGAPAEPPAGGEPPADGAAGAEPPPAGSEGEIFFDRREGEAEQEFLVDGKIQVDLQWHEPVPLDKDDQFTWAPDVPGVYVIYIRNSPWYVGIAETSIRQRFLQRRKALKDLQIPASALAGRSGGWYALRSGAVPRGAIQRRPLNGPTARFRPLFGKYAILRILEQFFIKQFKTATPKGNGLTEKVRFSPRGSLSILQNGAQKATLAPNSQI
jgi:hypothetical protein